MAQDMGQLTDMWMVDPTMFDPTQKSNRFSLFNDNPFPWPPSYNTGAGGPVNAATGKPIQSFQDWQKANPGGTTLNATPAQPQARANTGWNQNPVGSPLNPAGDWSALAPTLPGASPQAQANYAYDLGLGGFTDPNTKQAYVGGQGAGAGQGAAGAASAAGQSGAGAGQTGGGMTMDQMTASFTPAQQQWWAGAPASEKQQAMTAYGVGQTPTQAAPQASGPPNNWMAALNSLSNPGTPAIQGANVPMISGSQPAGGVNNAYLQQAGGGQGMNQGFLSALAAIQGRPQGGDASAGGGAMAAPSQGVPGTAFSQPLQQGGTPSWRLGPGGDMGNSLAGFGNTGNPMANLPAFAAAQRQLLGR